MLPSNVESKKLFSKLVPITIKDEYSSQSRSSNLLLTVEWQESRAGLHNKEILITLTDANDPFFLYNLQLSEEDYNELRRNQRVQVDFLSFPQRLIERVEMCLAESSKSQPSQMLILNIGEKEVGNIASTTYLEFVQYDPFINVIVLSLKFLVATESSVKQYLAISFRKLKEENQRLENRLALLEKDFNERSEIYKKDLEDKSKELDRAKNDLNSKLSLNECMYSKELREEKEKYHDEKHELIRNMEEKEQNFKRKIRQLESTNTEIQDKLYKQEDTISELYNRIHSLEEDLKQSKDSLRTTEKTNQSLQKENKEKQDLLSNQKAKIRGLEEKIKGLERDVNQNKEDMQEMIKKLDKNKKIINNLEIDLTKEQELLRKKGNFNWKLEQDIEKANQIIAKLQKEGQGISEKLESMSILCNNQQQSLKDKQSTIQLLKHEREEKINECRNLNQEVRNHTNTIAFLEGKLKSLEKDNREKNAVIKYLNRQLTDHNIFNAYVPPPNLVKSYPAILEPFDMHTQRDNNNSPTTASGRSKSASSKSAGALSNEKESSDVKKTDSGYTASPSCNTKSTKILAGDINAHQTNLEIDSQAISAAFGDNRVLKHSTAKKETYVKNTRIPTKKKSH